LIERRDAPQGCQIFLGATYQNLAKLYQLTWYVIHLQNGHTFFQMTVGKLYQMKIKYTHRPSKICINLYFWYENIPSSNWWQFSFGARLSPRVSWDHRNLRARGRMSSQNWTISLAEQCKFNVHRCSPSWQTSLFTYFFNKLYFRFLFYNSRILLSDYSTFLCLCTIELDHTYMYILVKVGC
jgi:hypothetical protein